MTRPGLLRYARRAALLIAWLAWLQSVASWLLRAHPATSEQDGAAVSAGPPGSQAGVWFSIALLVVLGACLVAASLPRHRLATLGLRGFVLCSGLGLMLLPTFDATTRTGGAPPLAHVCATGLLLTCVAWSQRWVAVAAAVLLGLGETRLLLLLEDNGVTTAVLEGLLLLVMGLLCPAMLILLERAAAGVDEANIAAWRRRSELRRAQHRAQEMERWDALLHDKVLGAFHLALRGDSGAVALAREALAALEVLDGSVGPGTGSGPGIPPTRDPAAPDRLPAAAYGPVGHRSFAGLVSERAAQLGLRLRLEVNEPTTSAGPAALVDDDVLTVLVDATSEALTNVARHSGDRQCSVVARLGADRCSVRIIDAGVGFEPLRVDGRRRGLRGSVMRRMEAMGGTARVHSRPGGGCRVALDWTAPTPESATEPAQQWDPSSLRHLLTLGVVATGLHIAIGAQYFAATRSVGGTVLGACAIVGLTLMSALVPMRNAWAWAVVPLTFATQLGLAALVPPPVGLDWRYWFIGAQDTVIGLTAFRQSWRVAASAVVAAVAGIALGMMLSLGLVDILGLLAASPQLVLVGGVSLMLRRGLDSAATTSAEAVAQEWVARTATSAQQERQRVAAERRRDLRQLAVRSLRSIARGLPLDTASAERLERIEAALRDRLVAGAVHTPELAAEVDRARCRGVRVELTAHADATDEERATFGASCRPLLQAAPGGSTVIATFNPAPGGHLASVVLVGSPPPDVGGLAAALDGVSATFRPVISADSDSVLVELWRASAVGVT